MNRNGRSAASRAGSGNAAPEKRSLKDCPEFLRRRDPAVMGTLMRALGRHGALLSWLTPEYAPCGLPSWVSPGAPWLTLIDDLDASSSGPESFDEESVQWWNMRASVIAIDTGVPTVPFYWWLGSLTATNLVIVVQTIEARRLLWHKYFELSRPLGMRTL
jgi:hypothetical protein